MHWHHTHTRKATLDFIFNTLFCYPFGVPPNEEAIPRGRDMFKQSLQCVAQFPRFVHLMMTLPL